MNGGYIYGDANMFGAVYDAVSKNPGSTTSATYKNAFHEAKRLLDSGKPIYFKYGNIIVPVLTLTTNENSIVMGVLIDTNKLLFFNPSTPDTIEIN